MKGNKILKKISLSIVMTGVVVGIILITLAIVLFIFIQLYTSIMEKSSITSSEQAVVQAMNTVEDYTDDMSEIMELIAQNIGKREDIRNDFFENLLLIRSDVVAVTTYDADGKLRNCWSGGVQVKENIIENLSYMKTNLGTGLTISKPHVESLFVDYYPWVVTISDNMTNEYGETIRVCMDIRFSNIAQYVDDVGIGQHGYCFILDNEGNIVYHPQQQLLYSGLKKENTNMLIDIPDGTHTMDNVIYTVHTMKNGNWRIVGACFVDELITRNVVRVIHICVVILVLVLLTVLLAGNVFSKIFTKPAAKLSKAMGEFEKDAENFHFTKINGTSEIISLSSSFSQMVIRIQKLMERVRQEEVSLRKTELKALQAQINPHFLYNTLDSIAWMCEEERTREAVFMVNALARLFRISISKGNELIPLAKELQHAESYLQIQNFRYKNQFTYQFDVDEECLEYLCNKITLQPIIENAIYHGINRMVDEGKIEIKVQMRAEDIILTVKDNGVGMEEAQCMEILHKESSDRTGIGIKNVHERIQIYFGKEYGLYITSELDVGTCVEIKIPKIQGGKL